MRRIDKKLNMMKANLLAESRYLESKELIKEGVEKTDSDIDELAKEVIKISNGNEGKENELIISTANGDEDIQRRLTSRVQQLKNSEAINEIGPETARKALSYNDDPRKKRILQDATNSLFAKYINNKEIDFSFQATSFDEHPVKYVLAKVITNHNYSESTVDFHFHNENGVSNDGDYVNGKIDIVLTYNLKTDEFKNARQLMNATTAVFLVKAANWIRSIYFKTRPPMITVDGEMVVDPEFNINSRVKKQDFKMFATK